MLLAVIFALFVLSNSQIVGVCVFNGTIWNPTTFGVLTLTFDPTTNLTNITGFITGIPANNINGLHIHAFGDISDPEGLATGPHWNPFNGNHSYLNNPNGHAGDLGNVTTDSTGTAYVNITSDFSRLIAPNSAIGRGMIIHQHFDDGVSQPAGNSGNRFGQCVIGIKNLAVNQAFSDPTNFATCELRGKNSSIAGRVLFTQNNDNTVTVNVNICGLPPNTFHGIHIHQFGDLSGSDITFLSGGHFNPFSQNHAYPNVPNRHMGDLGNITVGSNGIANYTSKLDLISLNGPNGIVGRSVIVHISPDDGVSQPAGNSGEKIAACVIGLVNVLPPPNVPCVPLPPPGNNSVTTYLSLILLLLISLLF